MTRKITPAQLDEIEAAAKEAHAQPWGYSWESRLDDADFHTVVHDSECVVHIADVTQGGADAEHIAMMDPATTLALVAEVRELKNAARLMQSVIEAKYDRFAEIADIPAEEARCMDPQLIEEAALARVRELRAKVERVREVHQPIDAMLNPGRHERVVKVCTGCGTDDGNWQRWPCPTIRALDAN